MHGWVELVRELTSATELIITGHVGHLVSRLPLKARTVVVKTDGRLVQRNRLHGELLRVVELNTRLAQVRPALAVDDDARMTGRAVYLRVRYLLHLVEEFEVTLIVDVALFKFFLVLHIFVLFVIIHLQHATLRLVDGKLILLLLVLFGIQILD